MRVIGAPSLSCPTRARATRTSSTRRIASAGTAPAPAARLLPRGAPERETSLRSACISPLGHDASVPRRPHGSASSDVGTRTACTPRAGGCRARLRVGGMPLIRDEMDRAPAMNEAVLLRLARTHVALVSRAERKVWDVPGLVRPRNLSGSRGFRSDAPCGRAPERGSGVRGSQAGAAARSFLSDQGRSKRSRFITLLQAATKASTNLPWASALPWTSARARS